MFEFIDTVDKSIRSYILNDVISKKPINESFNELCEVIGKDAITFYDFQFWYYRFLNGDHDLDFHRSSEPEPRKIEELTMDLIGKIVNKCDIVDRFMLRKVSKQLHDIIENQKTNCDTLRIGFKTNHITASFDSRKVVYAGFGWNYLANRDEIGVIGAQIVHDNNYEKRAFDDLKWLISRPKLELKVLDFDYKTKDDGGLCTKKEKEMLIRSFKSIKSIMSSLSHQFAVRKLEIVCDHPHDLLSILPFLKPGVLRELKIVRFGSGFFKKFEKISEIVNLEQWKQARELELMFGSQFFPFKSFANFRKVDIYEARILDHKLLNGLKHVFSKSAMFEQCRISTSEQFNIVYLSESIGVAAAPNELTQHVRHHNIRYSNKYLEFQFSRTANSINIEAKWRYH